MGKKSDGGGRHLVVVAVSCGVSLLELAIATEVFGVDRRDITPAWYEFVLVAVDKPGTLIAHGLTVPAGQGLAALRRADTVIIPASANIHGRAPAALVDALRAAHAGGSRICAISSGSFVLAEAGLLDGRRATTHWMYAAELVRRYPAVNVGPAALYVHDDVWTSAGSAAGLDMCLELVRRDHGTTIANEVARRILIPPHRGQQHDHLLTRPPCIGRDVEVWALRNLASVTVTGMADFARVSTRTLHRQFHRRTGQAPQAWLKRLRVRTAAELLETTDLTVEAVARHVGLGTAANLREQFAAAYGIPPGQYRQSFGKPAVKTLRNDPE
jgi:AraC family transcriptional regulator, transcriptional activator FtrA